MAAKLDLLKAAATHVVAFYPASATTRRSLAPSPLRDDLLAWRAALVEPTPGGPFFPTRTGSRRDKDNINGRVLRPAVRRAIDVAHFASCRGCRRRSPPTRCAGRTSR